MPNNRKRLEGRVIRHATAKTVVVEVESTRRHPLYQKVIRTSKHYIVHDESDTVPVGALVRIVESRPISKTKRWAVESVLQVGAVEEAVPGDIETQTEGEA